MIDISNASNLTDKVEHFFKSLNFLYNMSLYYQSVYSIVIAASLSNIPGIRS